MADRSSYPSEQADKFLVRLPEGMRAKLKSAADANKRSMNAEIVARLESTFPQVAYERFLPERLGEGHDDIVARHIESYKAIVSDLNDKFEQAMREDLNAYYADHLMRVKRERDKSE